MEPPRRAGRTVCDRALPLWKSNFSRDDDVLTGAVIHAGSNLSSTSSIFRACAAVLVVAVALVTGAAAPEQTRAAVSNASSRAAPDYVPGQLVVGYKSGTTAQVARNMTTRMGVRQAATAPSSGEQVVSVPKGVTVQQEASRLRAQPGVAYAVPNYIAHVAGLLDPQRSRAEGPNRGRMAEDAVELPGGQRGQRARGMGEPPGPIIVRAARASRSRSSTPAWRIATGRASERLPTSRTPSSCTPTTSSPTTRFRSIARGTARSSPGSSAESTNNHLRSRPGSPMARRSCRCASSMPTAPATRPRSPREFATPPTTARRSSTSASSSTSTSTPATSPTFSARSATPTATGRWSWRRPATRASSRSPTRRARPMWWLVGATTKDRCLADYSNGGSRLALVAPGGGEDSDLTGDPDCHPDAQPPQHRRR